MLWGPTNHNSTKIRTYLVGAGSLELVKFIYAGAQENKRKGPGKVGFAMIDFCFILRQCININNRNNKAYYDFIIG